MEDTLQSNNITLLKNIMRDFLPINKNNQNEIADSYLHVLQKVLNKNTIDKKDWFVILYIITLNKFKLLPEERMHSIDAIVNKISENINNSNLQSLSFTHEQLKFIFYKFNIDELQFILDKTSEYMFGSSEKLPGFFDSAELESYVKQSNLHLSDTCANFSGFFDACFYNIIVRNKTIIEAAILELTGKTSGSSSELTDFLQKIEFFNHLAHYYDSNNVYNLYASMVPSGVHKRQLLGYFGQSIDQMDTALAYLYLLSRLSPDQFVITHEDPIDNWNPAKEKYDLIISNKSLFEKDQVLKWDLFETAYNDSTKEGRIITSFSWHGYLAGNNDAQPIRKKLIQEDILEAVIKFPKIDDKEEVFLICSKQKKHKERVILIDAERTITNDFPKHIKYGLILEKLQENDCNRIDCEFARILDYKRLLETNYDLNPTPYFYETDKGTPLSEFIYPYEGSEEYTETHGLALDYNTPVGTPIKCIADDSDIKEVALYDKTHVKGQYVKLTEDCLVIDLKVGKYSSIYIELKGQPVFAFFRKIDRGIAFFRVDTEKISIPYLIFLLQQESTRNQILSHQINDNLYLTKEVLQRIRVELPTIDYQLAFIQGLKEEYIRGIEKDLAMNRELLGIKEETYRNFKSIRHSFRQFLAAMQSNVSTTQKFLKNNPDIHITAKSLISSKLNRSFEEHLESLNSSIMSMNEMLKILGDDETYTVQPQLISPREIIRKACNMFENPDIFTFAVDNSEEDTNKGTETKSQAKLKISEADFFRIFSNIVSNAIDHGFKNKKKKNIILIKVLVDRMKETCIFSVSNNGASFPESFGFRELITIGEKSANSKGLGLGGADIKNLVSKYNGSFELKLNETAEFPVEYIITFPLERVSLKP